MTTLIVCLVLVAAFVPAVWLTLAVLVCLHIDRIHREMDANRRDRE